jgi:ubiquinone/menaquinone biosynthesis C-methylase UbiE
MEVLFNEKIAQSYDRWAETPQGRKAYGLEGELLLTLGEFAVGQRVLEVGCGTGSHLEIFLRKGLTAIGIDISPFMLRVARQKLGEKVLLCLSDAENLPFKNKSFDCVALITTLEFIPDPERAVREALRVSRGKVLLGVLNKYSFLGMKRRLVGMFRPSIYNRARFYSIWELRRLVRRAIPEAFVDWASILVLPMGWQQYLARLERRLSFRRNPLGAFLVVKCMSKGGYVAC